MHSPQAQANKNVMKDGKQVKKVLPVFGTRPGAIQMCPLVNELKTRNNMNPYGDGHARKRIADVPEGKDYEQWTAGMKEV